MIKNSNRDIIFLSKSKTAPTASSILHIMDFILLVKAPPSSSRGRLLLAWESDVKLTCFHVSSNIISVWRYSDSPSSKWLISFVYGPIYKKNNSDL
jgi:hypothetical protein